MKGVFVAAAVLLAAARAGATQKVVVLEPQPTSDLAWPAGERAVVAELLASDVELVLRSSNAPTVVELEREVLAAAAEPDTAGAVGVGRDGNVGFALVAPHSGRPPVRVQDDVGQGAVAEGAVALRVSEVLRARRFDLPPEAPRPPVVRAPDEPEVGPVWPWFSFGGVAARGASSVAPAMALGVRVPVHPWVSLEPSAGLTLGGLEARTAAGDVALSARRATLELVVAPTAHRGLSAGAGAGGGVAWVLAVPRASAGYEGVERSTEVSMLTLRGFAAWQARHLKALAFLELAAMLPAVTVRASGTELARVGQPWVTGGLAVGYSP
jgi:hypothetical protein